MSEQPQQPQQSEEIDLGQLFKMIGDMFNRFFAFLGKVATIIFNFLLLVLVFLRRHVIKIAITAIIGLVIGFFYEITSPPIYGAQLMVETKFDSAYQLYNNIRYYDALAKDRDSIRLAQLFNITQREAAQLEGFYIEADDNKNKRLLEYAGIMETLDTASQKQFKFIDFDNNLEPTDYKFHKISVGSYNKYIFPKIQNTIINSIENNEYFKSQQEVSLMNLKRSDSLYKIAIVQADEMRDNYMEIRTIEANRDEQEIGTSIYMRPQAEENPEVALLQRKLELNDSITDIAKARVDNHKILKVISAFPEEGFISRSLTESHIFRIPIYLVCLLVLILLLRHFNTFLKSKEASLKEYWNLN